MATLATVVVTAGVATVLIDALDRPQAAPVLGRHVLHSFLAGPATATPLAGAEAHAATSGTPTAPSEPDGPDESLPVLAPAPGPGLVGAPSPGSRPGAGLEFEIPGWQAEPPPPEVAITFDDGPDPAFTPQVLDILASRGDTATFFFVGGRAARATDLVQAAVARGNTVGGHTWSHVRLNRLDDAHFAAEVDSTDQLLGSLTGRPVRCVRPPYGRFDPAVVQRLNDRGLVTLMWNVDPRDWSRPGAAAIVRRVVAGLRPGAVIILHDAGGDRSQTVEALPAILDAIRDRGFRTVPLCG